MAREMKSRTQKKVRHITENDGAQSLNQIYQHG